MTTSKFSPGDRVRVYERSQHVDGVVDGIWPDGLIRVKLDFSSSVISYHPKQLRRLKKRKKVVWESEKKVERYGDLPISGQAKLEEIDAMAFCSLLKQFIGKRVRIVITEAKGKE